MHGFPASTELAPSRSSMYPSAGRKKNCTPRRACSSVSSVGSDGSTADTPSAGDVNTVPFPCTTLVASWFPVLERSGVFLYS